MGILSSNSTTLKIVPIKREFPKEEWIETLVEIEYHFNGDVKYIITPKDKITFEYREYQKLVKGVREFINKLKKRKMNDFSVPMEKFHFLPLETDFKLICFGNAVTPNNEGEITLQYMLNLGTYDTKFSFDFIGGEINVDVVQLLQFVDDLENQVNLIYAI